MNKLKNVVKWKVQHRNLDGFIRQLRCRNINAATSNRLCLESRDLRSQLLKSPNANITLYCSLITCLKTLMLTVWTVPNIYLNLMLLTFYTVSSYHAWKQSYWQYKQCNHLLTLILFQRDSHTDHTVSTSALKWKMYVQNKILVPSGWSTEYVHSL